MGFWAYFEKEKESENEEKTEEKRRSRSVSRSVFVPGTGLAAWRRSLLGQSHNEKGKTFTGFVFLFVSVHSSIA